MKNVIWLCDDCLEVFNDQVFRQLQQNAPANIETEIHTIKEKLTSITEVLATLTLNHVTDVSQGPREETFGSIQRPPVHPTQHSTPISELNRGTRIDASSAISYSSTDINSVLFDKRNTFSLFLSNIDTSVAQQEISNMIEESLGINEETEKISIVRLVPKWNTGGYAQYASYKVIMDKKHKRKALQTGTWPMDITFREFFDYAR